MSSDMTLVGYVSYIKDDEPIGDRSPAEITIDGAAMYLVVERRLAAVPEGGCHGFGLFKTSNDVLLVRFNSPRPRLAGETMLPSTARPGTRTLIGSVTAE